MSETERTIGLGDIEARLRTLGDNATSTIAGAKPVAAVGGVVGGAVLLALSFLLGRRRGRKRASILEVHRS